MPLYGLDYMTSSRFGDQRGARLNSEFEVTNSKNYIELPVMTCVTVPLLGSDFIKAAQKEDDLYLDRMRSVLCTRRASTGEMQMPAMLLDHMYLGNMNNANDHRLLRRMRITHVLNCAGKPRDYSQQPFDRASGPYDPKETSVQVYLQIEARDVEEYPILMHYGLAREFLDGAKASGGRVLVHCEMGVNRSAALCVAYLLEQTQMTLIQVLRLVKIDRPVLLLNDGFRKQLMNFAKDRSLLHRKKEDTDSNDMNT
ncbi:hypothetical protein CAPTEDRAFT_222206 [Capitella teleta]|uniref:protein-tyrosine-phosphatase n=1 Tax=Capitella teleta TaxID=283909 RepID=R7UDA0_CAPTE|nr:hypothetical protein CAPTEDRAFT_222206 [Capitella teleta]|eukprot:ELU01778.1 hypothetical protein CAPTEDRAFT_222206 [Capitella teleta]